MLNNHTQYILDRLQCSMLLMVRWFGAHSFFIRSPQALACLLAPFYHIPKLKMFDLHLLDAIG